MEIHLNAGLARFINIDFDIEEKLKEYCFKWVDRSIQMQNLYSKGPQRDPIKYCYDEVSKSFQSGLIPRVCSLLIDWDVPYIIKFDYEGFTARSDIETPDWAWDHQRKIIDDLMTYRRSVCQSPTASGKSSSISLIIEKFPERQILVVLHQLDLIYDLATKIEQYIEEPVGIIGGGKTNWQRITVGSAASLKRHAEGKFKDRLNGIEVLIFDECHHYANNTGLTISKACPNTSYRCGLSATIAQEDGSDILLEGVIGPTFTVIPDTTMVELGVIHRPDVYFIEVEDPKLNLPVAEGLNKPERYKVVEAAIINNLQRNQLIVDIVKAFKDAKNNQGCALVLVEDVKNGHGDKIVDLLAEQDVEAISIKGETSLAARQEILDTFKVGGLKVLVATRILNEGKDVPLLELVINAAGGSGKRGIIQKVGRALRTDPTGKKTRAIIVDFWDMEPNYLNNNSRSRMKHLNSRHPECARLTTLDELYATFQQTGN